MVHIKPMIIRGEDLAAKGFGGIFGVGKAAIHPPALVVLSHKPSGATESIAWVGKGIVYDTGGLSIKTKVGVMMARKVGAMRSYEQDDCKKESCKKNCKYEVWERLRHNRDNDCYVGYN